MEKKLLVASVLLLMLLGGAGYLIGSGFVDYALYRANPDDPTAIPEAAVAIVEPGLDAPAKPQAESETWTITSADGLKLVATHFSPAAPGSRWVILVHGYGRDQRFVWDYAAEYLKQGYHVLTPDLRAAGRSEGKYFTMGVRESDDIVLWAKEILRRDASAKIALHGISMGAATVMMATAKQPPQVVAAVEDCGYTSAYDMFTVQLKKLFGLPEFPVMNCVDVVSRLKTGAAISAAAPYKSVPYTGMPMLFIHGDADKLVPVGMMEKLYAASAAPVKEKWIVPGAGHADAKNTAPKEYFTHVFDFLETYMRAD
ncbi:alpha/beta hydrolase [Selenomonas caprae]|uniref:Alpha/beta hydrolase n=1 Tax=Selenomonas caprae TaxID=2606905 RepID=A0A5D6WSD5_9FIRM|nr:alpha/beta hydrolase [Selenomonas caprae]TYZ30029.1 alpha/beta hydrolase [Selenomonas caprae]